jgi:hypothetical protein
MLFLSTLTVLSALTTKLCKFLSHFVGRNGFRIVVGFIIACFPPSI